MDIFNIYNNSAWLAWDMIVVGSVRWSSYSISKVIDRSSEGFVSFELIFEILDCFWLALGILSVDLRVFCRLANCFPSKGDAVVEAVFFSLGDTSTALITGGGSGVSWGFGTVSKFVAAEIVDLGSSSIIWLKSLLKFLSVAIWRFRPEPVSTIAFLRAGDRTGEKAEPASRLSLTGAGLGDWRGTLFYSFEVL